MIFEKIGTMKQRHHLRKLEKDSIKKFSRAMAQIYHEAQTFGVETMTISFDEQKIADFTFTKHEIKT